MKKIHGTRYAYVAKSEYPALDKLEQQALEQQKRIDALIAQVKQMITKI